MVNLFIFIRGSQKKHRSFYVTICNCMSTSHQQPFHSDLHVCRKDAITFDCQVVLTPNKDQSIPYRTAIRLNYTRRLLIVYYFSYKPQKKICYSNEDKMASFLKKLGYLSNGTIFLKVHCFIFLFYRDLSFGSVIIMKAFLVFVFELIN